jgi:hypothetical protein
MSSPHREALPRIVGSTGCCETRHSPAPEIPAGGSGMATVRPSSTSPATTPPTGGTPKETEQAKHGAAQKPARIQRFGTENRA